VELWYRRWGEKERILSQRGKTYLRVTPEARAWWEVKGPLQVGSLMRGNSETLKNVKRIEGILLGFNHRAGGGEALTPVLNERIKRKKGDSQQRYPDWRRS